MLQIISIVHYYFPFGKGCYTLLNLLKKLNSLHPWIVCAKFGLKWSHGSGEDENLRR